MDAMTSPNCLLFAFCHQAKRSRIEKRTQYLAEQSRKLIETMTAQKYKLATAEKEKRKAEQNVPLADRLGLENVNSPDIVPPPHGVPLDRANTPIIKECLQTSLPF